MSAERGPDLRSYGRLGDAVICEMGGYCCWGCCALIPSLPNDMERGGGGGYDDQFMSSRDEGSVVAVQVAECDGAWGVKGEKAGVMGDSCGYDRHVALRSPGLEELGLASADIQLVMLGWPYSYVRVVDALEGTAGFLAPTDTASNRKETDRGGEAVRLTLRLGREVLGSRRLHGRRHVLDAGHGQLRVMLLAVHLGGMSSGDRRRRRSRGNLGTDRRPRRRLLPGIRRRLLVYGVEAALLLQADTVDASPLDIGRRRDASDLSPTAVALGDRVRSVSSRSPSGPAATAYPRGGEAERGSHTASNGSPVVTQLVSPLFGGRHAHRRVFGVRVLLRRSRRLLRSNARRRQRTLQLHLGQGIVAVLVSGVRIFAWPHLHARRWRYARILGHVPGRRKSHVGAVRGRRRRVLVGHNICHMSWRLEGIRRGGTWSPKVQFRLERRRSDDCHEKILVLHPGAEGEHGGPSKDLAPGSERRITAGPTAGQTVGEGRGPVGQPATG